MDRGEREKWRKKETDNSIFMHWNIISQYKLIN